MADAVEYERVRCLLARKQSLRAHAMGICGVGLSGVAQLLVGARLDGLGCDADAVGAVADTLRRRGVAVFPGHDPAHLDQPCELLIRSAAVPDGHPEVCAARARGIPVARRGTVLAAVLADTPSVVVCGTHGKTTTACFALRLLQVLGADPNWCIGGHTASMGAVARCGGTGPLVIEGDESDGTLAHYAASVLVVTNVDADHMEHFGSEEALQACFASALAGTREGVVFCADDPAASRLCAQCHDALGFGFDASARLRITRLEMQADSMTLAVSRDGAALGEVTLPLTGRHNALNAVAAMGAVVALGHDPAMALRAMADLKELPGRRFERLLRRDGVEIISDYSHHPAEIAALVALARLQAAHRIVAVFQPHRYTRTRTLGQDFPQAFAGVDELVLLPIYAAAEAPLPGGATTDLYGHFRAQARVGVPVPRLAESLEGVAAWLLQELRAGDLLLVIGAGDVVKVGHAVAHAWRGRGNVPSIGARLAALDGVAVREHAPLAPLTTLGVGGYADCLVDVTSEDALSAVLRLCHETGVPCRILGGGSNTLVGDLGVRGVVCRLAGPAFSDITLRDGGVAVVGCAVSGTVLLNRLTDAGLDGLSFMDGIPGRVGGWVATNAGAHGACIGARVHSIRGLKIDGSPVIVNADEAGFGYRQCYALENVVAVAVVLSLHSGDPAEIAGRRSRLSAGKRLDFEGRRSAGSVFRNPPDAGAGQLLDAAGCKGMRVGWAQVYERHANVIVTAPGATASDVLALMQGMRERVLERHGIALMAEVRIWHDLKT